MDKDRASRRIRRVQDGAVLKEVRAKRVILRNRGFSREAGTRLQGPFEASSGGTKIRFFKK